MLIHPRNPETVYVAAVGDLWAPNPEQVCTALKTAEQAGNLFFT